MTDHALLLCVFSLDYDLDAYRLIGTLAEDGATTGIGEAVKRWRRLRRDADGKPERWIFWDEWDEYIRLSHGKSNGQTARLALPADRLSELAPGGVLDEAAVDAWEAESH